MKRAAFVLAALSLCLGAPALSEPAPAETAIEPTEAPVMPIRVGGPCTYETTEIEATVVQVAEGTALMSQAEDRNFNLTASAFAAPPEPGDVIKVTKRKITKGTCQPLIYTVVVPPADETLPAN